MGSHAVAIAGPTVRVIDWRIATAVLLVVHVILWTWVGVAARSNLDVPGDMVESYVWGQTFEWGYYKHPPLAAWITGAWFSVVPEGHFGFALLAALNAAVGLAGVAVLARRLLPPDWALLCVAATALTPGVTTLAMRFNPNAVLVATWPWAIALFVRMMQNGRRRDAVGCGVACALAMLGKYYSAVLLLSLLASALLLPAWRRRFATAAPWMAILTFVLCLLPHLDWLLSQTAGPMQYAQEAASEKPQAATLRALYFGLSQWLFPALAFGLLAIALDPPGRMRAWRAALFSLARPRREAPWLLGAMPIVVTMLATVLTGARTASVWGVPIAAGVAVLALTRARAAGAQIDLARATRAMLAAGVLVAVLAPLLWLAAARSDSPSAGEPREELARAVDALWRTEFDAPLPWVSGTRALAASVAFYADSHPRYWSLWNPVHETPWVDEARVFAEGGIVVCAIADTECARKGEELTQRRQEIGVAKRLRGFAFAPRRYLVYLLPPRASTMTVDSRRSTR